MPGVWRREVAMESKIIYSKAATVHSIYYKIVLISLRNGWFSRESWLIKEEEHFWEAVSSTWKHVSSFVKMLVLNQCRSEAIYSQSFFCCIFSQMKKKSKYHYSRQSRQVCRHCLFHVHADIIFPGLRHCCLLVLTPSMSLPRVLWFLNERALRFVSSIICTHIFLAKY